MKNYLDHLKVLMGRSKWMLGFSILMRKENELVTLEKEGCIDEFLFRGTARDCCMFLDGMEHYSKLIESPAVYKARNAAAQDEADRAAGPINASTVYE